ncbi:glycosyltransferase family 2 protein [Bifidobacterium simiarum]|nr:glycosyltransferase family 2 protein [Bifidobacterium simiarum]
MAAQIGSDRDEGQDLVSVIVPVYNVRRYLKACLDRLIEQTYRNLEIILVDDGSTDGSGTICDEYVGRDGRIRVIHQGNRGLSAARNTGLDHARGTYVCFVDSDDIPDDRYVEILVRGMETHHADVATIRFIRIDENGRPIDRRTSHNQYGSVRIFDRETAVTLILTDRLQSFSWAYAARLSAYNDHPHIRFPEGRFMEDIATTYRVMARSSHLAALPDIVYAYRERSGSILRSKRRAVTADTITAVEEILESVSDLGLSEDAVMGIRCHCFELLVSCHYDVLRNGGVPGLDRGTAATTRRTMSSLRALAPRIDVSRLPAGTRLRWRLARCHLSPVVAFVEHILRNRMRDPELS